MSKTGVAALHSRSGASIAIYRGTINHIESILSLIQPQLEIGRVGGSGEVNGAPFDIEDAVGSSTGHRGIDTAGAARKAGAAAV